jgi:hypothetical protein
MKQLLKIRWKLTQNLRNLMFGSKNNATVEIEAIKREKMKVNKSLGLELAKLKKIEIRFTNGNRKRCC